MAERFFRATALAGNLHLIDFPDWDPWEPRHIQYRSDAEVGWLMRTGASERHIIRTVTGLDAALEESASPRGIYLYISESLVGEAKLRWEEMKQKRRC